jgi:hypothetical protein
MELVNRTTGDKSMSKGISQINADQLNDKNSFADDEKKPGLKTLTLRIEPEMWKALKLLSLELEQPTTKLMREALNEILFRHGKIPVMPD